MPNDKYFWAGLSIRAVPVRFTHGGSMNYMLLIYDNDKGWAKLSETQRRQAIGEYVQFTQQLQLAGQYVTSSQLEPTSAATSVRARSGKRLVTGGPFAETREQLLGNHIIDVSELDVAFAIAARIPAVQPAASKSGHSWSARRRRRHRGRDTWMQWRAPACHLCRYLEMLFVQARTKEKGHV